MWLFLTRRVRMIVLTFLLGLAAPRAARVLRSYGERKRRAGGSPASYRVPLGAASALEKVGAWARPPKER
ncbi:MAG: hypothetical protein AVDCRST_MAG41-127, partial [uncultured Corynebacteriales bacterium]